MSGSRPATLVFLEEDGMCCWVACPQTLKLFQLTLAAAAHTHCGITTDVACCLPGASSVPPGKQLQGWKWLVLSWLVESLSLHSFPCIQPLPTPRYQAPPH